MRVNTLSTLLLVPAVAYAQSSSAGIALSSAAESASSAVASGTASSAVASGTASSAAPSASASGAAAEGAAYLTAVLGALTAANLTSLVGVASAIANTTEGMALLTELGQGNKTVFAPSNAAFSSVPEEVSGNTTLLTQILSYHILNNTYTANGTQVSPNHTIARTLLRGGGYSLPANRSAPVVLSRANDTAQTFTIVQSASNVTAQGPAMAANLYVYIIDEVLTLPPTVPEVATALFPSLAGVIQSTGLLDPLSSASGITIFAPNDAAIGAIMSTLGTLNNTQISTVLANHVINGTAVYSDRLAAANYTSAAGQPFTFMSNATGAYVMSANSTARILQSDIITNNGVVHVIDSVLVNTGSDATAANDAFTSATAAAETQTEATAPVTATSAGNPSGSAAGSSGAAGKLQMWNPATGVLGAGMAVLGAFIGGGLLLL